MAIKILSANLNLQKGEIQNAVIQNLAGAPSSPVNGQIYVETTGNVNRLYVYNATAAGWQLKATDSDLLGGQNSAYHLGRGNHTGSQAASTISDFNTAADARVAAATIAQSQVTNLTTDLAAKAPLASPTFTGTPAAPTAASGTNTTQVATTAYVVSEIAARLAAADAMTYKGAIDASTNPNYPAASAGDTYRISVAGKIGGASGPNVEAGDLLLCHVDSSAAGNHATVGANWDIIQINIDGAATLTGSQTLTNKTINASNNTITNIGAAEVAAGLLTGQTAETVADNADLLLIYDNSATALRKMTRANFLSGVTGTVGKYSSATHSAGTSISIPQTTHGLAASRALLVQVLIESTGELVLADVTIAANGDVTVSFAASQSANTIRVNILG